MSTLPSCLMHPSELDELARCAVGGPVLEIGSWEGMTTCHLACYASVVWTVDHHRGDDYTGPRDTLGDFFGHLDAAGVRDRVVAIVADLRHVRHCLPRAYFSLVLVDGAHDADSTRKDIVCAQDCVRRGGTVAVHDYGRYDVTGAVLDKLGQPPILVESLAVYRNQW